MTGRENIYLNGKWSREWPKEISSKPDEIIEFSAVPGLILPVKRYSSGCVCLALPVAHL
jgi:ABC-type polysaccharide/polyol phosphate transport system ATPase subunit